MEATALAIGLTASAGAVGLTIGWVRFKMQRKADHMRRSYELHFPKTMNEEQVLAFIRSLSGLPGPKFLRPVHAIVFETVGDVTGVRNYIHIPGHVDTRVDTLLEEHIDGVSLTPVEDDAVGRANWYGVELGMRGTINRLRVDNPKHVAASIRAAFRSLAGGEALVLQWIIFRDIPRPANGPDKAKVADHTFHAVARIGAIGEHPERMVRDVYGGLSSTHAHGTSFVKRLMPGVSKRIQRRAGTVGYPIFLNAQEFMAVMGWPLDGSGVHKARRLEPDHSHDREGIILGYSDFNRSRGRPVALPPEAGDTHVRILGGSGTGKSTLLLNLGVQWFYHPDTAFILLEPAGDLAWDMLKCIPHNRINDVIWLDPLDTDYPIGINPLASGDPERATSHVVSVFKNLSGDSWGHQMQRVLTAATFTAALTGDSLYDVRLLLVNKDYREAQLRKINRRRYPDLFDEWSWISGKTDIVVDSSVNRLDSFLSSRTIRNIVSQRQGLDFDAIIRDHKILLVPLPAARMGQGNASAIGQLVREMAWNAAMKQDPNNRQRSVVMLDEFQNFADFSTTKSDPFSEARKYKQQYYIANQYTEQLPTAVQHTVDKNVGTQIVFRLAPEEAKKLTDRYKPLSNDDLSNLPRYHIAARVMSSSGLAPTVTLEAPPPPKETGQVGRIIQHSRSTYARPVAEVEAEIYERHRSKAERKLPEIGEL